MKSIVFAALLISGILATGPSPTPSCAVVHLSDFHFDPFYGTPDGFDHCQNSSASPFGEYRCDSPYSLIKNAAEAAVSVMESLPDETDCVLVLYTGDWVRHGAPAMPNANEAMVNIWKNISALLTSSLSTGKLMSSIKTLHVRAFPNIAGVSIGNEDFNPDYNLDINNTQQSLIGNYSKVLLASGLLSQAEAETFGYCGYSSTDLPGLNLTVVALNTVIYATLLTPKTTVADPCNQFAWLRAQLTASRASQRRVHITAHIPPVSQLWQVEYFTPFAALMNEFKDVVAAHFYGHTHATSFGVLANSSALAPMFISGSITKVSTTNPTFQVYRIDKATFQVQSWAQWYLAQNNSGWLSEDVGKVLNVQSLDGQSLYAAGIQLRNNLEFVQKFFTVFEGGVVPAGKTCDSICQRIVACSTYALSLEDVVLCML